MMIIDFPFRVFFTKLYKRAFDEDVFSTAAQIAFYFSFAIFPLLLFLVSLFGLVLSSATDLKSGLFQTLSQIMPPSVFQLIRNTIEEVTASSSGGKLTIGFIIALWSAVAAMESIRIALNSIFRITETRSWLKTNLIAVAFTFVLTIMISIVLAIVFYGWKFIVFGLTALSMAVPPLFFLHLIEWCAIVLLLLVVFDVIYNFIPNHSPFRWKWITPGAVAGIILWLILSNGLRLYLNFYNSYSVMYGSLGAVIIMMLWLYLTSLVILVGGLINAIIPEIRNKTLARVGATDEIPAAEESDQLLNS